ncbi:MAG: type II toxin-antitoxin system PemK/MazF family toxin [Erysipelotrichaceae bacterium]|nr:type II toxin-antitoxin system PemK/MazF family toxin [Erysipelotrichaceae bacterium]MBR3693211.1 type II toxin-antitoxin system PemK/MazF family toxin [Erysipelotrichales bacterium]
MVVHRGDIYYADLSPVMGSEQGGIRPVVVVQNEKGNRFSKTVIIAPISTRMTKPPLPTHVVLPDAMMERCSMVLLEQLRTIDKQRLGKWVGRVDPSIMVYIDRALRISLGI